MSEANIGGSEVLTIDTPDIAAKDPVGSFFDTMVKSDEFRIITTCLKEELDTSKLYGTGTVIMPTTESRLRHLQKIARLERNTTPEQTIRSYNKVLQKTQNGMLYSDLLAPQYVSEYITASTNEEPYLLTYATVLALLQKDAEQDSAHKIGPKGIQDLYGILTYAVNPLLFTAAYQRLVREQSA